MRVYADGRGWFLDLPVWKLSANDYWYRNVNALRSALCHSAMHGGFNGRLEVSHSSLPHDCSEARE